MWWNNPLTVQLFPLLSELTTNCIDCGTAKQKATIQTTKINLTARDNLDIVCCLFDRWRTIKQNGRQKKIDKWIEWFWTGKKRKKENMEYVIVPLCMDHLFSWFFDWHRNTISIFRFLFLAADSFRFIMIFVPFFFFFFLAGQPFKLLWVICWLDCETISFELINWSKYKPKWMTNGDISFNSKRGNC